MSFPLSFDYASERNDAGRVPMNACSHEEPIGDFDKEPCAQFEREKKSLTKRMRKAKNGLGDEQPQASRESDNADVRRELEQCDFVNGKGTMVMSSQIGQFLSFGGLR